MQSRFSSTILVFYDLCSDVQDAKSASRELSLIVDAIKRTRIHWFTWTINNILGAATDATSGQNVFDALAINIGLYSIIIHVGIFFTIENNIEIILVQTLCRSCCIHYAEYNKSLIYHWSHLSILPSIISHCYKKEFSSGFSFPSWKLHLK